MIVMLSSEIAAMSPQTTNRGRSRLSRHKSQVLPVQKKVREPLFTPRTFSLGEYVPSKQAVYDWLQKRVLYLWLAGAALIGLFLLLTTVSPSKVANIGLAETYLPLVSLSGLLFFSLSRLVLGQRHAWYVTLTCTLLLFLQVHAVILPPAYFFVIGGVIGTIELIILLAKNR